MGGALGAYNGQQLSAGASGAVFGLLAASLIFELFSVEGIKKIDKHTSKSTLLFILGINVAIGLIEHNIDNWAHLGGLMGGALVALCLLPAFKSKVLKGLLTMVLSAVLALTLGYGSYMAYNHTNSLASSYLAEPFKAAEASSQPFTLSLPDSWRFSKEDEKNYILGFGPLGERLFASVIYVNERLDNVIHKELHRFKKEVESTDSLEFNSRQGPESIQIKDLKGYAIYWNLARGEVPYSINEYYFELENKIIYLTISVQTSDKTAYTPLFMRILESIKAVKRP